MGSLPGPPVPVIAQGSNGLYFLKIKDGQLDPRLIRHFTKFFKHSDVSKIGFPTPVLQFGNNLPRNIWKRRTCVSLP